MHMPIRLVCLSVVLCAAVTTSEGFADRTYPLTVQQLQAGLKKITPTSKKEFFLIDVRSAQEHATGFIPGTDLNIEFRELPTRHREIGATLDAHLVVYCQAGPRAHKAAGLLADLGYRHVYTLTGSMNAWQAAGFPIEPGHP